MKQSIIYVEIFSILFVFKFFKACLYPQCDDEKKAVKSGLKEAIKKQRWRKRKAKQDRLERVTETEDFYYQQGFF